MIKIAAIDHLVLRTANLDAMLRFYTDVLGCKVERQTPPDVGLTQLRAGTSLIDIVEVDSELGKLGGKAPTATGNNMDHFCLQLKKISQQTLTDHLLRHGINEVEFSSRYGAQGRGPSVYIKDPDGNTVELKSQIDCDLQE
ncbi:VOC family protein [Veronia pacifica]|uniref:Lactoylglutathione lyase n=1 Tax=Veronia pacifica TaxID=1080227 RepID=A0A1C3EST6_9GAMM|nr:VOC family protein [Veronia pacifica]ODA36310.1 lactoylglutathione lyase [Veronia pacifica]